MAFTGHRVLDRAVYVLFPAHDPSVPNPKLDMFSINLVTWWLGDFVHLHRMSQADTPRGRQGRQHRIFLLPSPDPGRSYLSPAVHDAILHFIRESPAWQLGRGSSIYIASGKLGKEKWVIGGFFQILPYVQVKIQHHPSIPYAIQWDYGRSWKYKVAVCQLILVHLNTATNKNTSWKNEVFETNAIPRECWECRCKLELSWANWGVQSP